MEKPKTIILDEEHAGKVGQLVRGNGKSEADVVHAAIDEYYQKHRPSQSSNETGQKSCYDLARQAGLVGCLGDLPADLSTNPEKYMEGFGRD